MSLAGLWRWLAWVALAGLALQVFFIGRIALMAVVDPQSTSFERSEAWRLWGAQDGLRWRQQWTPYETMSIHIKRAVIAAEDGSFVRHDGVEWEAIEKAWQRNSQAEELAAQRAEQARLAGRPLAAQKTPPKIVGGSTITQQLAKNLLLSGERTLLRKAQEFVLTLALERLLTKRRILELYLNHVEWGEGVFGIEAAARHYYRKPASALSAWEAARLAVMLPRPKYFEKLPRSAYLSHRAGVIAARMNGATPP